MNPGMVEAEQAAMNMLQRYNVLMVEDFIRGRPDFDWTQMIGAINRLSRKNLITFELAGRSYQIHLIHQEWSVGRG